MIPSEERSTAVGEVWWVQWAVPGRELRGWSEEKRGTTNDVGIMQPAMGGDRQRLKKRKKK